MSQVSVATSQNVDIDYEIASVGQRILAVLFDLLLMAAYLTGIILLIYYEVIDFYYYDYMWYKLIFFLPLFLYHLICEVFMNGQSFGKQVVKIKVIKKDGSQATLGNYVIRWMFRIIEGFMFFYGIVGLIAIAVSKSGQRIGDIAAKTTVIRTKVQHHLSETILSDVKADYKVKFPQVELLDVEDIHLIKDSFDYINNNPDWVTKNKISQAVKSKVEKKLNIETEMLPIEFIKTIINDYNYINGVV